MRVTNSVTSNMKIYVLSTGMTSILTTPINNPVINTWYLHSGVLTCGAGGTSNLTIAPIAVYADATTANGKVMEVQEVFSVDLTSLFGAGNEPQTVQQCDEMFSNWFDGSIRMNLNRYNGMLGSTSAVDVNDPTYDGTGLSFGGDDYVGIGNIGKEMRTCHIVFYTPSVINKDSAGKALTAFSGTDIISLFVGSVTSAYTNEIITIYMLNNGRVSWGSDTENISIGWHLLESSFGL